MVLMIYKQGGIIIDYHKYLLSIKEYIIYSSVYIAAAAVISHLFYDSFIPVFIFIPGMIIYFKNIKIILCKKRNSRLTLEFKDFINAVSSLLSTGYSLENAIVESKKELLSIHGDSLITRELEQMTKKLLIHIPPEEIFNDFASRTDINFIKNFSEVINIAKHSGGDLISIIMSTSLSISSHIEIQQEIDTNLSEKKHELYIMSVMPLIIMIYISLSQPGFFDPVYHNAAGILLMSICLIIYAAAIFYAYRIINFIT